jgi:hypothetical protein
MKMNAFRTPFLAASSAEGGAAMEWILTGNRDRGLISVG